MIVFSVGNGQVCFDFLIVGYRKRKDFFFIHLLFGTIQVCIKNGNKILCIGRCTIVCLLVA